MTICIYIHTIHIYLYTRYTVHAAYNCAGSSIDGFGKAKGLNGFREVKHSETGFQMDRFSYTTQGFYFSYIGGMCLYWGICFHKFKYHNLDEHFYV